MQIGIENVALLENYLDTATLQLKVTAQNMANVDTPGYKTRGFSFEQELQTLVDQQHSIDQTKLSLTSTAQPVEGLISRPDGNNVSMDREGLQMAEAQLKFRTGIALLKQEFSQVSEAIHSDTK